MAASLLMAFKSKSAYLISLGNSKYSTEVSLFEIRGESKMKKK